jgi:hypothetical protein
MVYLQQRAIQIVLHVCALDFLGKYLYFAPNEFTEVDAMAIFNIILLSMIQFPDATNLITSMFRFLRTAMRSNQFQLDIFGALVPMIAESQERTAIVASSGHFFAGIETYRKGNRDLHTLLLANIEYCQFLDTYVKKYLEDMKVQHGGPITRYVTTRPSIDEVLKRRIQSGEIAGEVD